MMQKRNKINLRTNTYRKKISIFFACLIIIIGIIITIGINLFGSNEEDITVPKMIAYFYNDEKHDAPPAKEKYEIDVVHCDKATGSWDNVTWKLTLSDIEGKATCVLNYKRRILLHTFIIDPNGGTYNDSTGTITTEVDETHTYSLEEPTRKGYTFAGWELDNESSKVEGNIFTMGEVNTTATAKWNINSYGVQVKDSYTCDKTENAEYNSRFELCEPVRDGYTFTGWETTSGTLDGNALILDDSAAVVTATWTINNYDYIVYHKQEALANAYTLVDTEIFNADFNTTVRPNTKTYTGFTSPERRDLTITSNAKDNVVEYLYSRNNYTLTINPNGGITPTALSQSLKYEQSVRVESPTRRGYDFIGWTKTSGILQDEIFTIGASNATLTANYRAITSTLYFDGNLGGVSQLSKEVTFDQPYGELPTPVREGYTFEGWFLGGEKITSSTIVDIIETSSVVAHWTKNTYTLTINPDGGTFNGSTATIQESMQYEDEMSLLDPTREGYTFDGWMMEGRKITYDSQNKKFIMGSSDATLTARWTINKYVLTIQDSNVCDGQYNVDYHDSYQLCTPVKEGYTFAGWEDIDAIVEGNVAVMKAKNSTLKANWIVNTYNFIVYHNLMNLDGETYEMVAADTYRSSGEFGSVVVTEANIYPGFKQLANKTITIAVDEYNPPARNIVNYNYERNKYTLTINTNGGSYVGSTTLNLFYEEPTILSNPTKTGYNFTGWSKVGNATLTDNALIMGSENTTLNATYNARNYTVQFNANSGSVTTSSKTVTYDLTYGDLPTPVRTGYNFTGWYTDPAGGTRVVSTDTVKITDTQTLYAHWELKTYTINFNANGGSVSPTSTTVTHGSTISNLPTPTKSGVNFGGWYKEQSFTNKVTSSTAITSDIGTLYARWYTDPTLSITSSQVTNNKVVAGSNPSASVTWKVNTTSSDSNTYTYKVIDYYNQSDKRTSASNIANGTNYSFTNSYAKGRHLLMTEATNQYGDKFYTSVFFLVTESESGGLSGIAMNASQNLDVEDPGVYDTNGNPLAYISGFEITIPVISGHNSSNKDTFYLYGWDGTQWDQLLFFNTTDGTSHVKVNDKATSGSWDATKYANSTKSKISGTFTYTQHKYYKIQFNYWNAHAACVDNATNSASYSISYDFIVDNSEAGSINMAQFFNW